jgi:hypothetical protein
MANMTTDRCSETVRSAIRTYAHTIAQFEGSALPSLSGVVEVSEAAWDKVFRRQSQKRLSHHEARDPDDGPAGQRLNHQHLVGCRLPSPRDAF